MYPYSSESVLQCQLDDSEHVHERPAILHFDYHYSTPTRLTPAELRAIRDRVCASYRAGFPGWSSREIDAAWRWLVRH